MRVHSPSRASLAGSILAGSGGRTSLAHRPSRKVSPSAHLAAPHLSRVDIRSREHSCASAGSSHLGTLPPLFYTVDVGLTATTGAAARGGMGAADEDVGRWSMSTIFRKVLKTTWVLINVLVLIALPLCAWDMYRHNMETHYIAWFVGGVFVLLAMPITFYEAGGTPRTHSCVASIRIPVVVAPFFA